MGVPPAVGGNRLEWSDLPAPLRVAVEAAAGAPVTAAESQPGGFSPGLASVLRLAGGGAVFVKAVGAGRNPDSPGMYRREARVLAALPPEVPAPRLLWTYDDGDWVALMTEAVEGRSPAQPWRPAELARFLHAITRLAAVLTPAPLPAPAIRRSYAEQFTGWHRFAADPGAAAALDPCARARLDRLAEIEAGWPAAAAGDTLLHADLRADNVLLTPDGGVRVVDWPHACVGAPWVDLICALPAVAMQGGGDPERLWREHPLATGVEPAAATAVLAALVGFFLWQAGRPPPPNLPRLRAFQSAQGEAGLAWLGRRLS